MFGRTGWICNKCNNFNFESRNRCNRCFCNKDPKTIEEINKKKEEREKKKIKKKQKEKEKKTDWLCLNCQNLNYGFRKNCNRCQIERQNDFPSVKINNINGSNINNSNYEIQNNNKYDMGINEGENNIYNINM